MAKTTKTQTTKTDKPELNKKEEGVLKAIIKAGYDSGYDFAIKEDVSYGRLRMTPFQFGAYISLLIEKGYITFHSFRSTDGETKRVRTIKQFCFTTKAHKQYKDLFV